MGNTDNNIISEDAAYTELEDAAYTEREEEMYESFRKLMSEPDYRPLKFKDLCSYYEVEDGEKKDELLDLLNRLCNDVKLIRTKNFRYMLPPSNVMVGIYNSTRRGFGFVTVEGEEEDIFVAAKDSLNAFHGDKVLITLINKNRGPRKEARIDRVLSRNTTELLGVYQQCEGYGFVIPNNKKIASDIYIPSHASNNAVTGSLVIASISSYGDGKKSPEGSVSEVIGHIDDPRTDILQVVRTYGIPVDFPDDVEKQLDSVPDEVSESEKDGRRDFRSLDTITIDGEDAKDLDDAISLEYKDGVYHLGVHIADVSNYVKEGSPLDKEALKRGTSNYLIDSVIPMLPHKLSNGICSLNHDVDRLTLSCLVDIDESGKVINHEIVEGLINVNERMNYHDVASILEGRDMYPEIVKDDPSRSYENLVKRYKPLIPMIKRMHELSLIIREVRRKRGSIDFDVAETKIVVDESGVPVDMHPYDRDDATRLIEDFMLMANETVAEEYFWADIPFEYRIHETPDLVKVDILRETMKNFGKFFKVSKDRIHPKEYQKLLDSIKGEPYEALLTKMTLRSMQQARYATECSGHFGLACKYYCHFTSPIRRYPDLQIHRIIKENLHGELTSGRLSHYKKLLPKVSVDNSEKERRAVDAERDVVKLKQIEYMSSHIGESFEGVISGFTAQNIFVELPNTVEGAVKVANMTDDSYTYYENKFEMVGNTTNKVIRLGDKCCVKLVRCDKIDRVIDFEFV
ncbi:MAG: ribonuclease R [Eubacterium sp.]|nr:ribonuclease R [Eubacterium sp.]